MDNDKENWRRHKEDMRIMRDRRRQRLKEAIRNFRGMGFEVVEISPYQYRFNNTLDIYPSNKRFHDLTKDTRGDIRDQNFDQFLRHFFGLAKKTTKL